MKHSFLFLPGIWEGEGTISFSMANDVFPFKMRWEVGSIQHHVLACLQTIEIENFEEIRTNLLRFNFDSPSRFQVALEGAHMEKKVSGKGFCTEQVIAWEYHETDPLFAGLEVYTLLHDGTYAMKAEYSSDPETKTFIQAIIQRKDKD